MYSSISFGVFCGGYALAALWFVYEIVNFVNHFTDDQMSTYQLMIQKVVNAYAPGNKMFKDANVPSSGMDVFFLLLVLVIFPLLFALSWPLIGTALLAFGSLQLGRKWRRKKKSERLIANANATAAELQKLGDSLGVGTL